MIFAERRQVFIREGQTFCKPNVTTMAVSCSEVDSVGIIVSSRSLSRAVRWGLEEMSKPHMEI